MFKYAVFDLKPTYNHNFHPRRPDSLKKNLVWEEGVPPYNHPSIQCMSLNPNFRPIYWEYAGSLVIKTRFATFETSQTS